MPNLYNVKKHQERKTARVKENTFHFSRKDKKLMNTEEAQKILDKLYQKYGNVKIMVRGRNMYGISMLKTTESRTVVHEYEDDYYTAYVEAETITPEILEKFHQFYYLEFTIIQNL
jgi:hypothetical protein